ncbi:MAG: histidine phosphatase family protein [Patescibacteria group bacterium]
MDSPNRPALLVLIRHGESLRNALKGSSTYYRSDEVRESAKGIADHDIPLVDEGWRQARQTGLGLHAKFGAPDYLYHSGYRRTKETADGILEAYSDDERARIKIRSNLFLRERDSGYAYDMTETEARLSFPWLKEHWETFGGFMARPPGGESLADVMMRAYLVVNMLFRDRRGQKVFLVTHGGTIRCLRCVLERQSIDEATRTHGPRNCGLVIYEPDATTGRLVLCENDVVLWSDTPKADG